MKRYETTCDCGDTSRHTSRTDANRALRRHVCPAPVVDLTARSQCQSCTSWFPLLVDGALCIGCDSVLFPDLHLAAIA